MSEHRTVHDSVIERLRDERHRVQQRAQAVRVLRQFHGVLGHELLSQTARVAVQRFAAGCRTRVRDSLAWRAPMLRDAEAKLVSLRGRIPRGAIGVDLSTDEIAADLAVDFRFEGVVSRPQLKSRLARVRNVLRRAEEGDVSVSQVKWDPSLILNHEYRRLLSPSAYKDAADDLTVPRALEWTLLARLILSDDPADDLWGTAFEDLEDTTLYKLRPKVPRRGKYIVGEPLRTVLVRTFQGSFIEAEFGTDFRRNSAEFRHQRWIEAFDASYIRVAASAIEYLEGHLQELEPGFSAALVLDHAQDGTESPPTGGGAGQSGGGGHGPTRLTPPQGSSAEEKRKLRQERRRRPHSRDKRAAVVGIVAANPGLTWIELEGVTGVAKATMGRWPEVVEARKRARQAHAVDLSRGFVERVGAEVRVEAVTDFD